MDVAAGRGGQCSGGVRESEAKDAFKAASTNAASGIPSPVAGAHLTLARATN